MPPSAATVEEHHSPGHVIAENLHPKYARQAFSPAQRPKDVGEDEVHVEGWHLDINTKELRWESYVKAGYYVSPNCSTKEMCLLIAVERTFSQGVLSQYFSPTNASGEANSHPIPVDLLVTGSVPAGSGLSSSAAMVVASTLAFLAVNGKVCICIYSKDVYILNPKMISSTIRRIHFRQKTGSVKASWSRWLWKTRSV